MPQLRFPEPVRALFGHRFFATGFLFGTAALAIALFDLGASWKKVLVVLGGIALGLIFDLWRHALRLESAASTSAETVRLLTDARDDAIRERDQALEGLDRLADLEAENLRLATERDDLLQRSGTPRALLEDVLQTVDGQLEILGLVQKHRAIQTTGGAWQWPVTTIRPHDDSLVAITAHADDPTPYASEWLGLSAVATAGFIASAQAAPSENQLTVLIPFINLPEHIQEPLITTGMAPATGYVLKLLGVSISPYDRLDDSELARLSAALRNAASAVSSAVVGEPSLLLPDPEEDQ